MLSASWFQTGAPFVLLGVASPHPQARVRPVIPAYQQTLEARDHDYVSLITSWPAALETRYYARELGGIDVGVSSKYSRVANLRNEAAVEQGGSLSDERDYRREDRSEWDGLGDLHPQ